MKELKGSHEAGELSTIKDAVLKILKKHPTLTAKPICRVLQLCYKDYKSYVSNIRCAWKSSLKLQQGLKVQPTFHHAHGYVYVTPLRLKREDALKVGWIQSRSKNKSLIWKDPKGLGRMVWFWTTGRVNLHIKPPSLRGRVYQLFCNGFSMTGLITSMTILGRLLESIRLKAAHAVFATSHRLPYMEIDIFKMSNGVVIKTGDKTHPNAIEVEFCYPLWAEKNERMLWQIYKMMSGEPPEKLKRDDKDLKYVS